MRSLLCVCAQGEGEAPEAGDAGGGAGGAVAEAPPTITMPGEARPRAPYYDYDDRPDADVSTPRLGNDLMFSL